MILGLLVFLMGILALIPSMEMGTEPVWHSWVKIVIGLAAVLVAAMDKKKTAM